jgi:hypothetical protein
LLLSGARTIEPAKDEKRNDWNLAVPRLHEDKFRVFRGQNEIPERKFITKQF